jgi:hypothetical protein
VTKPPLMAPSQRRYLNNCTMLFTSLLPLSTNKAYLMHVQTLILKTIFLLTSKHFQVKNKFLDVTWSNLVYYIDQLKETHSKFQDLSRIPSQFLLIRICIFAHSNNIGKKLIFPDIYITQHSVLLSFLPPNT